MSKSLSLLVHKLLFKNGKTIAVAESCTGGALCERLTAYPGSSSYFLLGVVTYSNSSKTRVLGVSKKVIIKKGAVSKETALLMAGSVRKLSDADIGMAITGIAGPTGAVPGKPVGTVFIALVHDKKTRCKRFNFKGNRNSIRQQAVSKALLMVKNLLI
jgi:nicotinamide-nucleotide amidase